MARPSSRSAAPSTCTNPIILTLQRVRLSGIGHPGQKSGRLQAIARARRGIKGAPPSVHQVRTPDATRWGARIFLKRRGRPRFAGLRGAWSAFAPSRVAGDAVAVAVEVVMVVADHLHGSCVVRPVAAPAFAVVVGRIGVEAGALVVRIAGGGCGL